MEYYYQNQLLPTTYGHLWPVITSIQVCFASVLQYLPQKDFLTAHQK